MIHQGRKVQLGDIIGHVGSTGLPAEPHLHSDPMGQRARECVRKNFLITRQARMSVKPSGVNWLPWPVLNMSGVPYRAIASSSASIQKEGSSVFDSLKDKTFLLA